MESGFRRITVRSGAQIRAPACGRQHETSKQRRQDRATVAEFLDRREYNRDERRGRSADLHARAAEE